MQRNDHVQVLMVFFLLFSTISNVFVMLLVILFVLKRTHLVVDAVVGDHGVERGGEEGDHNVAVNWDWGANLDELYESGVVRIRQT